MGSIFKKGKKWFIDYYDPNGKRVRKAISQYKEAAALALKKVEIDIVAGSYTKTSKCHSITFKDFAEKFKRKHIRRRNKCIRGQEYLLDQLVRHFGKRMLISITSNEFDAYLSKRQECCSSSTVNIDLAMLKSLYNRANEWDDLSGYNPVRDIKKLEVNNERCRYLTEEEQERLLSACSGITCVIVEVALKTGLRWGELINLKWQQAHRSNYVDFGNDTIFLHESLTKSKKSRYVPLAPSIKQLLMDLPQYSDSGYIFINPKTGKKYEAVKRSFHTAMRKAEIKDFRFHDLRHCFASDLVRKGVDLFVVQKLLGHSSPKMTQRYAHLRNDHLKEAILLLDENSNESFEFGHHGDTVQTADVLND